MHQNLTKPCQKQKKGDLTNIHSAQHPNAGQNNQQTVFRLAGVQCVFCN